MDDNLLYYAGTMIWWGWQAIKLEDEIWWTWLEGVWWWTVDIIVCKNISFNANLQWWYNLIVSYVYLLEAGLKVEIVIAVTDVANIYLYYFQSIIDRLWNKRRMEFGGNNDFYSVFIYLLLCVSVVLLVTSNGSF